MLNSVNIIETVSRVHHKGAAFDADRTQQVNRLKLAAHAPLSYIYHLMIKFDRNLLFYKLPLILYAVGILSVSAIPGAAPPSFGVAWEDKIYHGIEYLLLSLLVFRAFLQLRQPPKRRIHHLCLFSFGLLFGALDETLQHFVPGRDCSFTDWLADASGYLAGGFLIMKHRMKSARRKFP